ncbi:MAG: hypothetical protein G01um101416_436 [Microgenomates group bacterium Gr01-1014_16]|nr:MAG: hypothetical protein G01um101416_436 [Microgenomates group bacterium Gr01-1014_16]
MRDRLGRRLILNSTVAMGLAACGSLGMKSDGRFDVINCEKNPAAKVTYSTSLEPGHEIRLETVVFGNREGALVVSGLITDSDSASLTDNGFIRVTTVGDVAMDVSLIDDVLTANLDCGNK